MTRSTQKRRLSRRKKYVRVKPRVYTSELGNLVHDAREKLHGWFRENGGTVTYQEIAERLSSEFDITAGLTTLSDYYRKHQAEIVGGGQRAACDAATTAHDDDAAVAQTIVLKIIAPRGCRIEVEREKATTGGAGQ